MDRRQFLKRGVLGAAAIALEQELYAHAFRDYGSLKTRYDNFVNVLDYGADARGPKDRSQQIQRAVDTGRPVFFPPGDYLVGRPISVPSNAILFSQAGTATIRASLKLANQSLLQTRTIKGASVVYEYHNVTLDGLRFEGHNNRLGRPVALVRFFKIDGLTIRDCFFTKHKFILLSLLGCRSVSITKCHFSGWGKDMISEEGGPALYLSANPLDNTETRYVEVKNNTFEYGEWAAIYVYGKNVNIQNNRIRYVKESGIFCFRERAGDPRNAACEDLDVSYNEIHDIRQKYISATGMEIGALRATIRHNRIRDTQSSGIKTLDPAQDVLIEENVVINSVRSPSVFKKHGQIHVHSTNASMTDPSNISIQRNIIRDEARPKIAPAAIAVPQGATPIDGLKIRNNDLTGGYAKAAIDVYPGMAGRGSEISSNMTGKESR